MNRLKHLSDSEHVERGRRSGRRAVRSAILLVATIGMLAAAPAPARAASFPPRLAFAYKLAIGYWGRAPIACASIDKQIVPPGSLGNPQIGAISGRSSQVPAGAPPDSVNCFLWIDRAYAEPIIFDLLCAVMVHHVGHLLGYEHSPDPWNVMNERIPVPPLCRLKGRQSARLYLLRLKLHWLHAQRGPRALQRRRKVSREVHREAARFWSVPAAIRGAAAGQ